MLNDDVLYHILLYVDASTINNFYLIHKNVILDTHFWKRKYELEELPKICLSIPIIFKDYLTTYQLIKKNKNDAIKHLKMIQTYWKYLAFNYNSIRYYWHCFPENIKILLGLYKNINDIKYIELTHFNGDYYIRYMKHCPESIKLITPFNEKTITLLLIYLYYYNIYPCKY
ncbi:MAG TPA: hypothetical protein VLG50_02130 [Candidatus Saccharimonadales bacterium]|nr:hypothetical protein [Candidatus Saccharimonadales bacterium]